MIGFIFQLALLGLMLFFGGFGRDVNLLTPTVILITSIPWLITIWLTHKHKPKYYQKKVKYVMAPFLKAYPVHFVLTIPLLFLFGIEAEIIVYIIQALLAYYVVEYVIYLLVVLAMQRKTIEKEEVVTKKYEQVKFDLTDLKPIGFPTVDLTKTAISTEVLSELFKEVCAEGGTEPTAQIDNLEGSGIDLAIFTQKVNNIKDFNGLLADAFPKIKDAGYVVIGYEDLDDVEKEISESNGIVRFLKTVKYYIFDRAFPKIPVFDKIHGAITGGKNKVISKTEVWGRLMYAGFDVKTESKERKVTYLIAQKDRTASENPSPSFSPLIRLNRVGLYGNIIKIYKVRSMYPYSEFLQEKVFEMNSLTSTGKFSEDFRITKLGKIYRKYWLDELPQLLDWFRGSIKLVGIRAMSQHFFSLYTKEYQDLFYSVKPGIVSPIFDEGTDSFEMIQQIEQEYLEKYKKSPWKTDVEYFFITLRHMAGGVRSK